MQTGVQRRTNSRQTGRVLFRPGAASAADVKPVEKRAFVSKRLVLYRNVKSPRRSSTIRRTGCGAGMNIRPLAVQLLR